MSTTVEVAVWHVVCACGALVDLPTRTAGAEGDPGGRGTCRACGAAVPFPPESIRVAAPAGAVPPAPGGPPSAPVPGAPPVRIEFGHDERLDLVRLERIAAQGRLLSGISLAGGLGAALLAGILSRGDPYFAGAVGAALLGAGVLAWAAFRAVHHAALGILVVAERQRDLARGR